MLVFEAYDKKCRMASDWEDVTLSQAIEINKICNEFPKEIKDIYGLIVGKQSDEVKNKIIEIENALSDELKSKTLPALYGRIIQVLSDVPEHIMRLWTPAERTAFYLDYAFKFVLGIMFMPFDYKQKNIIKFNHEEVNYYLPETTQILNQHKPMAHTTAIEFTEVADLEIASKDLQGGKFERAANIVSILCRPKDEVYNENTSLSRVESFMKLPMDVVWEVFFCFIEPLILYNQRTLISSLKEKVELLKKTH